MILRAAFAGFAVLGLAQQAPATGTAVIAGQVIDATTKQPVAGAVVTAAIGATAPGQGAPPAAPGPAAPPRRAFTNAEGRFVLRDLPAGTYGLTATRNGYLPGAIGRRRPNGPTRNLTIAEGSRTTDVAIPIWKMPAISGVVRDDRGEPAVGMYVTAMRRTMAGGRMELSFSSGEATDDRGHYRISYLEPGSYVVMARTTPQAAPFSTVDRYRAGAASGTAAQLSRELREGGALMMATEGIVIDGWQVRTSNEGTIMPGPNGTLLLHPLTYYGNTASAAAATVLTLGPGDERQGIDFTLPLVAGVRVSGTLSGLDKPAASYGVQLVPAAAGSLVYPFPIAYSTTDAEGHFAILGVPPGSYNVRALRVPPTGPLFTPPAPGAGAGAGREMVEMPPPVSFPAMFAETAVTVGSAHLDGVALRFQTGARLSGRVVFEGTAAPPAAAQLQRIMVAVRSIFGGDTRATTGQTPVAAAGTFQTNGFAPGRYLMNVTFASADWTLASIRAGGVDASDQAVTLETADITDVVITFTDKSMTLSGSVQPAASTRDTDATVVAFPADYKSWLANGMSPRRVSSSPTSASGTYQLRLGIPGDYFVVAIPPEVAPDVDPEFIARFSASATRVSIAAGESKTQSLTVSRVR